MLRCAIIAALVAVLAGCSAVRLGYGSAPELLYWWFDGYVDFNEAQTPRARDAIAQWFAWHRRTQLPDYASLLQRAQAEVLADTTPERACAWRIEGRDRAFVAFEQALPALADIALTLTPQQLVHLQARYAKSNAEFADDYLQPDRAARLKAGTQRAIDRAESIYGRLDDAQRERVARAAARSPFDAELLQAERRHRQDDAVAMLRGLGARGATREEAQAALRAYAHRIERSPREEYRRYGEQLSSFVCAAAAELHNTTTAAQRQAAAQRLKGWESDLRALAADAR